MTDALHPSYDAFISYSRVDSKFAAELERTLEKYTPPKDLGLPTRRLRVFRDTADLTGTEYYAAIDRTIDACRKLLILCSPDSRNSTFVNDEVRRFVGAHGAENVIPILVRGRPNNEVGDDGDDAAFPPALLEAMAMPLATSFVGWEEGDRIDRGEFRDAWFTILANLLDRSREVVEQRDLKRRTARRRLAAIGSLVIGGLLTGSAVWAVSSAASADLAEVREERQRQRAIAADIMSAAERVEDPLVASLIMGELVGLPMPSRGREVLNEMGNRPLPAARLGPLDFDARAAVFSPDGQQVLLADRHGTLVTQSVSGQGNPLIVVDTAQLRETFALQFNFTSMAYSPDGDQVAAVSPRGALLILDVDSEEPPRRLVIPEGAVSVTYSDDGRRVLVVAGDGTTVEVAVDGSGDRVVRGTLSEPTALSELSLAFLSEGATGHIVGPDGESLVTIPATGGLRFWGPGEGHPIVLPWHTYGISETSRFEREPDPTGDQLRPGARARSVAIDTDHRRIVAGATDGAVRVWDFDGSVVRDFSHQFWVDEVDHVAASSDGTTFLSVEGGRLLIWSLEGDGVPLALGFQVEGIRAAEFSPDGQWVYTLASGRSRNAERVDVWRLEDAGRVQTGPGIVVVSSRAIASSEDPEGFLEVRFSPDGTSLLTLGESRGARVWPLEDRSPGPRYLTAPADELTSLAISPDDRWVAAGTEIGHILVWDLESQGVPRVLDSHGESVGSLAFDPNGRRLLSGDDDGVAILWDLARGVPEATYSLDSEVVRVSFLLDESFSASTDETTTYVWRDARATADSVLGNDWAPGSGISPDGETVINTGDDEEAVLRQVGNPGRDKTLTPPVGEPDWVAWSRDGEAFAVANYDGFGVFDAAGSALVPFTPRQDSPVHVDFSPDRSRLAVTGYDEVLIYGIEEDTATLLVSIPTPDEPQRAEFTPDGDAILVVTDDSEPHQLSPAIAGGSPWVLHDRRNHESALAAMGESGRYIATTGENQTVLLWEVGWDAMVERLRGYSTACLTPVERQDFLGENELNARAAYLDCEKQAGRTTG